MISKDKTFDHAELDFFERRYERMDRPLFERYLRIIFGSFRMLGLLDHYLGLYDLSQGRFHMLMELFKRHESGGITPGELATIMGVKSASITGLVDNLERDGMVRRSRNRRDRRKISIQLTEDGIAFLDSFLPFHQENIRQFLSPISDAEAEQMAELLQRLNAVMQPHIEKLEETDKNQRIQHIRNSAHHEVQT